MTRHKLTQGWHYDDRGNAESDARNDEGDCEQWFELYAGRSVGTKTFEPDVPVEVALAVIRSAGKDAIYEEVKELLKRWDETGFADVGLLSRMVAELED